MKKYTVTIYSPKLLAIHLSLVLSIVIPMLDMYLFEYKEAVAIPAVLPFYIVYYMFKKYRSTTINLKISDKGVYVEYMKSFMFETNQNYLIPWAQIRSYSLRETKPTEYLTITMKNGNKHRWFTERYMLREFYYEFENQSTIEMEKSNNIQKVPHYLTSKSAKIVALIILSLILIELILYLLGIEISIYHMGVFFLHLIGIIFLLVVTIYHFRKKPFY